MRPAWVANGVRVGWPGARRLSLCGDRTRVRRRGRVDRAGRRAALRTRPCASTHSTLFPGRPEALGAVRPEVWNAARRRGETTLAKDLKGARFALWKNPEHLTGRQQGKLAWIAATNEPLYQAYLLKRSSGWSSRSGVSMGSGSSMAGSPRRGAVRSRPSSSSPARSPRTSRAVWSAGPVVPR